MCKLSSKVKFLRFQSCFTIELDKHSLLLVIFLLLPQTAIDLGVDEIKIIWKNELPELSSSFGENWHPLDEPRPEILLRFGRNPPSKSDILQWCRSRNAPITSDPTENDDTLNDGNKTCLRVRRDSEDSTGSEMSMSPPSSLDGNEADVIEDTIAASPKVKNYSLEISGRTLNSSEMKSDRELTLRGVTEADEHNYTTSLSVEIFVATREILLPDPEFDAVTCIIYAVCHDGPIQTKMG